MTSSCSLTTSKISSFMDTACGQGPGESNELLQTGRLGAGLRGKLSLSERLCQLFDRPIVFQRLEHHFPPLRKRPFYQLSEDLGLVLIQQRFGPTQQPDAGRVNVWRRKKASRRDSETAVRLVAKLNQQREQAIILSSRLRDQTARHFRL